MLNRKYLRDGMVVWDNYDRRAQQGYTLAQSLKKYIANLLKHHHGTSPGHPTRARKYFEWTLSYLTKQHCRVLLVLLPIHPKVLKVIANDNWRAAHQNLLDYLTGLQAKYSFSYLDFTQIASFGGDPQAFYDRRAFQGQERPPHHRHRRQAGAGSVQVAPGAGVCAARACGHNLS